MRFLLLSVLVVCVIGVMVPNALAQDSEIQDGLKTMQDGGLKER